MSKKVASRRMIGELQALSIPAGVQRAVLSMLAVAWVGAAILTGITTLTFRGSGYGWVFIAISVVLPIIFFVTALIYSWSRYHLLSHKLFISGIIATSGYAAAQVLISVIFMMNNHFGWVATGANSTDRSVYSFEWLVMLLSYAAYVVVIGLLPHKKKAGN